MSATAPRGFGPDFWKLLVGQAVSNLGSSFTFFALPLLVYKLTGSALNLALVTVAETLPYLLFGLIIGTWADRVDRKRLMVLADLTQSLVIASIPLLAVLGTLPLWWIYIVGFANSTLWICSNTAEFASLPRLVNREDLVTANGHLQASYAAATVAGPLLAGLLVALVPIHTLLAIDAFTFLVSALVLGLIRSDLRAEGGGEGFLRSFRREVVEGLGYVLRHPVLRNLCLMMALVNGVGYNAYAQLVLFAKQRFDASDTQVGLLYAAGGLGMAVLALTAGPARRRLSFSQAILVPPMIGGVLIVLMASTGRFWVALALWALVWGLVVFFDVNSNSLMQTLAPNRLLGRIQSVVTALSWSAIPLGTFLGGVAIERTGSVALVYGVVGATVFLAALAFSFTAVGRAGRYLAPEKQPGP